VTPQEVVVQFNDCINRGDLEALGWLMTDDHMFTDSAGMQVLGKAECLSAWQGFFAQFPDYRNQLIELISRDRRVIVIGYSSCSVALLDGPALWSAEVRDNKIAHWRVYEDTPAVRAELGIAIDSRLSPATAREGGGLPPTSPPCV
jgi:ketosteroid isomerase-like protein